MATVAFAGGNLSEGQSQSVVCGDSSSNVYSIRWAVTLRGGDTAVTVQCSGTGSTTVYKSCSASGTYTQSITTTSTAPTITITNNNAVPCDASYITPYDVTYPTATSPDTPSIPSVENRTTSGDTSLKVNLSTYSDPGGNAVLTREVECYNNTTGTYISTTFTTTTSAIVVGLAQYTAYKFRVRDKNVLGNYSAWSAWSSAATTYSKPTTPTGSQTTITTTTAVLNTSAFANDDGSTHKLTQWLVYKTSDDSVWINDIDSTNKVSNTVTVEATTDYYWKARHQANSLVYSNYSTVKYFSTSEASSKKIAVGAIVSGTQNKKINIGAIIIDDPNYKRIQVGAIIGSKSTKQIGLGAIIIDMPWDEDATPPSTSWSET